MRKLTLCGVYAALLLVLAPSAARAGDDLKAILKVAEDSSASITDREKAVQDARFFAMTNKGKGDLLKQTIPTLLKDLEAKKGEAAYQHLVEFIFRAMDPFEPFPDLGPVVKPYLAKETDPKMRVAALSAIKQHGATGVGPAIALIFEEPSARKDPVRAELEERVVSCLTGLPGLEAEKVFEAGLKNTKSYGVRQNAVRALGELVAHKPGNDVDSSLALKVLAPFAAADYADSAIAADAALAMVRWGSWDGIAEQFKRCVGDKRGANQISYRTICFAAGKMPKGFADVSPDQFYAVSQAERTTAVTAMNAWWDKTKGQSTDHVLFDALAAEGVTVPKDTSVNNKETIPTLIAGLSVPNRTVRYGCLDLLVRRTGKTDLAKDFKILEKGAGKGKNGITITEEEPADGYNDPQLVAKLYDEQKERAKAWSSWWTSVSSRVTLQGGVWKVP